MPGHMCHSREDGNPKVIFPLSLVTKRKLQREVLGAVELTFYNRLS
jgi:hypothetical protein